MYFKIKKMIDLPNAICYTHAAFEHGVCSMEYGVRIMSVRVGDIHYSGCRVYAFNLLAKCLAVREQTGWFK
jgi:hypothetical protein